MAAMTIGTLSRRTGIPVKALRTYEDMGLLYTVGRSPGNYRLFDDEALWCVAVVSGLRELGLTLEEIRGVAMDYLKKTDEPVGPRLAGVLAKRPRQDRAAARRTAAAAAADRRFRAGGRRRACRDRRLPRHGPARSQYRDLTLPPGGDRSLAADWW